MPRIILTKLAASLDRDVSATSRELSALAQASVGKEQCSRVSVLYEDMHEETFGPEDVVDVRRPRG